jgi:TolA-binding protein
MNSRRILTLLATIFALAGCAGAPPVQESGARDEERLLREDLRKAEDTQQRLQKQLAELQRQLRDEQRKAEESQQKLQNLLAERQRQLRDEQRKVEDLEKKVEALRAIDRDTLRRAMRR